MKKIDLHMHTVSTVSDSAFNFSMDSMRRYATEAKLDAIAITNHNVFDLTQFEEIRKALSIVVFPGIEIDVEGGHLLVISDESDLAAFDQKCRAVSSKNNQVGDTITVDELIHIFGDLDEYLLVPHYDKHPPLKTRTMERLNKYISAGEVDSAKKFVRAIKDENKLTPLLFSDARISTILNTIPVRQTYVDCDELSLQALKTCLQDKIKVALSAEDGNALFRIFDDGQHLSTGLNVILGERSSGKTFTLNKIFETNENVKYIKQFALVQSDNNTTYERDFQNDLQKKQGRFTEDFLSDFRSVLNDAVNIDLGANDQAVERYVESLLKSAEDADRRDAYSKATMYDEAEFPIGDDQVISDLIQSVRQIIENIEYRSIIEKHLEFHDLKQLAVELIERYWFEGEEKRRKKQVNNLMRDIKNMLRLHTSATPVEEIDLYRIKLEDKKIQRFSELVKNLHSEATIFEESIQGFRIVIKKGPYTGALDIKQANANKGAFKECFAEYQKPYGYLRSLLRSDQAAMADLYKLFAKISYVILNKDGFQVSGGERSEFRLLQEIKDAQNYDMLLIDEPESSFDNMFLKSDVNHIIKEISKTMPVILITHNNTVGASIGADYLIYAEKRLLEGKASYQLYSGHPTNKTLTSLEGKNVSNHQVMLEALEAGPSTYNERGQRYAAIKN